MPFAKKRMGFKKPPRIFLKNDQSNANNPLGKTAYYDPENMSVTLYVTGRHPKDIMRSLSHELVHHTQNCNGEFDKPHSLGDGYAQNDSHLREMERQAYEIGNLCFRDWEDGIKNTTYYESLNKGARFTMSTKDWKNGELTQLLSEAWGFKFNSLQEFEEFDGTGEVQEEAEVQEDAEVQEEAQEDAEVQEESQEEVEESARGRQRTASADPARDDERTRPMEEAEASENEEVVEEAEEETQEESVSATSTISEAKIREILEKAIELAKARKATKE
tara:strand:- start:94 stop:921 length:828 start_codon:yes stop_codon:yes gene_type:complete